MHIPNGFLDPKTSAGTAFAAAAVLGYCIAKVRQALSSLVPEAVLARAGNICTNISAGSKRAILSFAENHLMKMGAVGSLIFAAQMFNFPVASGTSGHLLGGILSALALGPFSGTLVIAVILAVQSIFFADGGMMALGANIFNMAVLGTLVPYYIYYVLRTKLGSQYAGVAIASFFSVLLASVACSAEIALSGTAGLVSILPAMVSVHTRIGIAEALLTVMLINLLGSYGFQLEGKIE